MADTYTTNLNLTKPEPGAAEDTWGISLNADLDSLDAIFGSGGTAVSMGAVTLDGLTVQTTQGDIAIANSASSLNFTRAGTNYIRATDAAGHFKFITGANDFATQRLNIASNGDISFYDDTGSTQGLFWDASAERLGIGTTSPTAPLEVSGNIIATGNLISYVSTSSPIIYGGSTALELKSNTGELFAKFLNNGAAELYYDNSKKLETTSTGIDVTGTVTSDGLTVDSGTASTTAATFSSDLSNTWLRLESGADSGVYLGSNSGTFRLLTNTTNRLAVDGNGDISFYDDTGTTQALFWDASAENLFVGGTSTTNAQSWGRQISSINSGTNGAALTLKDSNGEYQLASYANKFYLSQGANTRFFINSSGSVGIGTTSPNANLHVLSSGNGEIEIERASGALINLQAQSARGVIGTDTNHELQLKTNGSGRMTISTAGNVGLGNTAPAKNLHITDSSSPTIRFSRDNSFYWDIGHTSSDFQFISESGGTVLHMNYDGNVGIGTDSPSTKLHVKTDTDGDGIKIQRNSTTAGTYGQLGFSTSTNDAANPNLWIRGYRGSTYTDNYMTFGTGGNTGSEALRIDSSQRVGIGTTSPSEKLHTQGSTNGIIANKIENTNSGTSARADLILSGDANDVRLVATSSTYTGVASWTDAGILSTGSTTSGGLIFNSQTGGIKFQTATTERMRIDSSGNVGIGTASPDHILCIEGTEPTFRIFDAANTLNQEQTIAFGTEPGNRTHAEIAGINTNTGNAAGALSFKTNSGASLTERMRIDDSGNLLVGTTTAPNTLLGASSTQGVAFNGGQGYLVAAASGQATAYFNRQTSDGTIAEFRKDGTTVGNIGCPDGANGSQLVIAAGTNGTNTGVGLRFTSFTVTNIIPCYDDGSSADNLIDLGNSGARFQDIYATNGTIQTSDINEKQDIEDLSEAETRVAVAAKGLLKKYRWKSAVADKGDDARIHFGIMAQDLQDAFTAEGLDAGDYGMFISSTWEDDDGVEQTRLGVRYNELLAFIIAAI